MKMVIRLYCVICLRPKEMSELLNLVCQKVSDRVESAHLSAHLGSSTGQSMLSYWYVL